MFICFFRTMRNIRSGCAPLTIFPTCCTMQAGFLHEGPDGGHRRHPKGPAPTEKAWPTVLPGAWRKPGSRSSAGWPAALTARSSGRAGRGRQHHRDSGQRHQCAISFGTCAPASENRGRKGPDSQRIPFGCGAGSLPFSLSKSDYFRLESGRGFCGRRSEKRRNADGS